MLYPKLCYNEPCYTEAEVYNGLVISCLPEVNKVCLIYNVRIHLMLSILVKILIDKILEYLYQKNRRVLSCCLLNLLREWILVTLT